MEEEIKRHLKNIEALLYGSLVSSTAPLQVKVGHDDNGNLITSYYIQTPDEIQEKIEKAKKDFTSRILPLDELKLAK